MKKGLEINENGSQPVNKENEKKTVKKENGRQAVNENEKQAEKNDKEKQAEHRKLNKWLASEEKGLDFRWVTDLNGEKKVVVTNIVVQLWKDILWVYDQNGAGLHRAVLHEDTFVLPYWEFLNMRFQPGKAPDDIDQMEDDRYMEGLLIVIIAMTCVWFGRYRNSRKIFGKTPLREIEKYLDLCPTHNQRQERLKLITQRGITLAIYTEEDTFDESSIQSARIDFSCNLYWVRKEFIEAYFKESVAEWDMFNLDY